LGVLRIAVGILSAGNTSESGWFSVLVTTAAMAGGVLVARNKLLPQLTREGTFVQRLAIGGTAAVLMFIVGGMSLVFADNDRGIERLIFGGLAALLPLFLLDWVDVMSPGREQRVMLGHAFAVGGIALGLSIFLPGSAVVAIGLAAGTSLLVQVLSPWHNPVAAGAQEYRGFAPVMREVPRPAAEVGHDAPTTPMRAWWQKKSSSGEARGAAEPLQLDASAAPAAARRVAGSVRRVPRFARYIWLALTTIMLPLGIMLIVFPNFENVSGDEFVMFTGFGVGALLFAVVAFLKSFQRRFHGWWRYLLKPLLMWACVQSVLLASIALGGSNLRGDEAMLATFFIVFPVVVFVVLTFTGFFRAEDDEDVQPVAAGVAGAPAPAFAMPGGAMNVSADAVTTAMPPAAVSSGSSPSSSRGPSDYLPSPGTVIHFGAALIGWGLLVAGTVCGMLTAIDLPGIIALQSRPSPFSSPSPGLIRLLMGLGTFVLMLVASGFLMGSRRPQGVAHGLRALGAVVAAGLCVCFVYAAFSDRGGLRESRNRAAGINVWNTAAPNAIVEQIARESVSDGQVIEQYIDDIELGFLIPAGISAVAAATLLSWPARRRQALSQQLQPTAGNA
jgi:hypothetical protein